MRCRTVAFSLILIAGPVVAADWPQWLGPTRNGISPEKGLITTFPASGPKVLWKVPGGDGYSSVAVVGDRAYTLVQRGKEELAICLDTKNGQEIWKTTLGPSFKNQYGNGPRSTPTVEGDLVYVQSVTGPLACLKAKDGNIVWKHDLLKEYVAKNIAWGLSASPLVDGNLVLAIPGAESAGVAAFDKTSGKLAWKTGGDKAAYATPVAATVGGKKQYIFFNAAGLLGVAPDTGKELWRVGWKTEFDCNICTPLVLGDHLFVSSGEKVGCAMFILSQEGPPTVAWESKGGKSVLLNYWANSIAHEGHLYGLSGEFEERIDLNCVEQKTGKLKWSQKGFGKGALTLADGHFYITTKPGDLVIVKATPEKYDETARVTILGENRTVPTISGGRLFLRDRKNLLCVDIKK